MAKKPDDPPKGAPAWQSTFSDLMNLLLCFFVLLFAMSSIDEYKMELIIASMNSKFNVLQGGSSTIGDGDEIGAGLTQLAQYNTLYMPDANSMGKGKSDTEGFIEDTTKDNAKTDNTEKTPGDANAPDEDSTNMGDVGEDGNAGNGGADGEESSYTQSEEDIAEAFELQELSESEQIAEKVTKELAYYGIQDQVEVDFNAQYVLLTLNGAILFDSGARDIREDAMPLVERISYILENFQANIIEVEGHTDNVPIHSSQYEDNNVLSMYRALTVADYLRETTTINDAYIKSSGRGDYVPIADNNSAEGRALNRRVVIKIFNSYNSDLEG